MLDKTILGADLYNAANAWNDVDIDNITQARKDFWNKVAEVVVSHIQSNGQAIITNVPVSTTGTATAQTGFANGTATIQ